jgi:hypothetical protein
VIDLTNPPFTTGALTTLPNNPSLDFNSGVGQRSVSYRFKLSNGVTGEQLGDITPLRNASLSHDTTNTIKRRLNLTLGIADADLVDPITARIEPFMVTADGREWPLGRYLFTDASYQEFTAGNLANLVLNDEMFKLDQQITSGLDASFGEDQGVTNFIVKVLTDLGVELEIERSQFETTQAWTAGTNRGSILEALALTGDYFSPWFGNDTKLHFVLAFDPISRIPDFDFDQGHKVLQASVIHTSDILVAPNRFVVISNSSVNPDVAVTGVVDSPPNSPNSFAKRGFYIPIVKDMQIATQEQAVAIARNLAQRLTIFERVQLVTPPDPRHDSYNVILWKGDLWLETAWSMTLAEGGTMTHSLRKGYTA